MREAMRATVLGAGSWGTTLAIVLAENGHDVALWDRSRERARRSADTRVNETFLPGVEIPTAVRITSELSNAVEGAGRWCSWFPHTLRETAWQFMSGVLGACAW
jgi:glycerol-3-phosphate dehydrogenase